MVLYYSDDCLGYHESGHPESPERLRRIHALLAQEGFVFKEPQPADVRDILAVHSADLVDSVKKGFSEDADTPALPDIHRYACLSAGSAVQAARSAFEGENAFSIMRPPGHHATRRRIMGFCYFNNIAVACAKILNDHPFKRLAVLDIDVHHGNGTEDIFYRNERVLFVSLHQVPLYPGTGLQSKGNCLNVPVRPGTAGAEYLGILKDACAKISGFKPELLAVSAGFDTYAMDPLAELELDLPDYEEIGGLIANLHIPLFCVLEGGYSRDLAECVLRFIRGLTA
ncbi:histone deacetylase [bacterium]|nr:histone deacetylase [bacterium]